MMILTPEQLTGRTSNHVRDVSAMSCRLHPAAADALLELARGAAAYDIDLAAASGFRDFERQLAIWNGKFRGERPLLDRDSQPMDVSTMDEEAIVRAILVWSALPGASRHHWGTEVDVYDRAALAPDQGPQLVVSEYVRDGLFARLVAFLADKAAQYGFFLPYDSERGGVTPEPWHLSYAPVAGAALSRLTLSVLQEALAHAPLCGAATVQRLLPEIYARYVCRIAPLPPIPAARPS
ncbi:MAG TPA: M15 family metallopeptidase [Steroidobacteraceae bacterium]|nr:M15 family metallopeptidase [Steroidobacteraceae bacterium]